MKAKDLMTKDVLSVDKDERIETVLTLMKKHGVSKLVATEKGKVVGIVTDGDIADELGALKTKGVPASQLHVTSAMRRKFASVESDTPLDTVLEQLLDQRSAGILPVMHDGHCVGVITASDLLPLVKSDATLQDIMTVQLHAVAPGDRVIHARRIMIDTGVERLPVIEAGRLAGIVGEGDIASGLARLKETVRDNHQAAALQRFLVLDIMRQNVVTATPETPVTDAAIQMKKEDVGSLPIVRGERIVGIVTRTDLLRLLKG